MRTGEGIRIRDGAYEDQACCIGGGYTARRYRGGADCGAAEQAGRAGGPVSAKIAADEFTLENSRGERLEFSRGELAGDMEAELPGEYREGEANQFELARGSDEYVFETAQERIELVLGNSEWEQAFEGSGVERAVFAPGAGLTLEGGLITGTVAVNYPAGAAYRPFRMDLCGEGTLSVKTTETGVEVSGLSDIRSIRASYSPGRRAGEALQPCRHRRVLRRTYPSTSAGSRAAAA